MTKKYLLKKLNELGYLVNICSDNKLQIICLTGYALELKDELIEIYPFLAQQLRVDLHLPDFIILNHETNQILCIGLGRKNNLFVIDAENNSPLNIFSFESKKDKYLTKFLKTDQQGVIMSFIHALSDVGLALDTQVYLDSTDTDYSVAQHKIDEKMSKIKQLFPFCEAESLNTGDY